ncbi:chromate efflux transporter [Ferrimonas sp. YFM]|uniref:chromate efflux transporter n=1 Tax=Ferrimonas sp. YFM TaxID=3028878 RepID=UPI00257460BB|nr:chromate efflux transporter [Ferrimonas sp. YFM]BDY04283.1 chorismate-binding protein [Ferrimonas sp. YFM]
MFEIFKTFLMLGCVSFGGPAAHIGYFRRAFVQQRGWLSDEEFARLIALTQFLPGPGSSQLGFALGHKRAGLGGAIAAFLGFTLPSVVLMILLASVSLSYLHQGWAQGIIHGLKLLAMVVVADAVLGMFTSFCKAALHRWICIISASVLLLYPSLLTQVGVLLAAALLGRLVTPDSGLRSGSITVQWLPLGLFALLWLLPMLLSLPLFSPFYQAGSLVFGGGHVVLPLLQSLVGGQMDSDTFLTGYAAAQAVPGPMFTLASFLGYHLGGEAPILGALIATLAIFLPGFLLLLGLLKGWEGMAQMPGFAGATAAINAAVTGILLAALYQPVFSSSVSGAGDMALVLVGFALLRLARLPVVVLVAGFALVGLAGGVL